jgi:hypothetical protein
MEITLTIDRWLPDTATFVAIVDARANRFEKTAMITRSKDATMFIPMDHRANFTEITRCPTAADYRTVLITFNDNCRDYGYGRATRQPLFAKSDGEPGAGARAHGMPDHMTANVGWITGIAHSVNASASVTSLTYQTARLPVTTNEVGYRT